MADGKSGLQRPVKPSADLAAITGSDPLPRSQVVSKVWAHIKANNLQNPANKREIMADDKRLPGPDASGAPSASAPVPAEVENAERH